MPWLILLAILIVGLIVFITSGLLGLVVHLIVAGLVGWLADAIVPGDLPFGWLGAIAAGLLGAWLGQRIIFIGPVIAGIPIISALLGAIILAFVVELIMSGMAGRRRI